MPKPNCIKDFEVPEMMGTTHSGKQIVRFDSEPDYTERSMVSTIFL